MKSGVTLSVAKSLINYRYTSLLMLTPESLLLEGDQIRPLRSIIPSTLPDPVLPGWGVLLLIDIKRGRRQNKKRSKSVFYFRDQLLSCPHKPVIFDIDVKTVFRKEAGILSQCVAASFLGGKPLLSLEGDDDLVSGISC